MINSMKIVEISVTITPAIVLLVKVELKTPRPITKVGMIYPVCKVP